jgi:hypothetical protein
LLEPSRSEAYLGEKEVPAFHLEYDLLFEDQTSLKGLVSVELDGGEKVGQDRCTGIELLVVVKRNDAGVVLLEPSLSLLEPCQGLP